MGGVGGGKVIMWEENSGTWGKHAAAAMYSCFTRSFRSTGLGVGAGGRCKYTYLVLSTCLLLCAAPVLVHMGADHMVLSRRCRQTPVR